MNATKDFNLPTRDFELGAVSHALDEMKRQTGGGDIPHGMIADAARKLGLSVPDFCEAAGRLNRPVSNCHVR